MHKWFLWFCWIALIHPAIAQTDGPDAILSVWVTAKQDGYVEIIKNGNFYEGTIVGSPEQTIRYDQNNPDPALRKRPLLGLKIMQGFVYAGDNTWKDGKIYDPDNGKTYRCKLKLLDRNTLEIRGYVGIPLFGRSEIWSRKQATDQTANSP